MKMKNRISEDIRKQKEMSLNEDESDRLKAFKLRQSEKKVIQDMMDSGDKQ